MVPMPPAPSLEAALTVRSAVRTSVTSCRNPVIPSQQGPDAQGVDPELDVVTMTVLVPDTLTHLHLPGSADDLRRFEGRRVRGDREGTGG